MNKLTIFHGSPIIIEKPIYGYGNPHNDYGVGFYCTTELELAKEWGTKNGEVGYANEYELNLKGLKILDLTDSKYSILTWIAILVANREITSKFIETYKDELEYLKTYELDVFKYDVVIGYRADDAYFAFPRDFVSNNLSLEKLQEIFFLGKLGTQIVLVSKKAFESLSFVKAHKTSREDYTRYHQKIENAKDKYLKIRTEERKHKGKYIVDLMEEDIKNV